MSKKVRNTYDPSRIMSSSEIDALVVRRKVYGVSKAVYVIPSSAFHKILGTTKMGFHKRVWEKKIPKAVFFCSEDSDNRFYYLVSEVKLVASILRKHHKDSKRKYLDIRRDVEVINQIKTDLNKIRKKIGGNNE